MEVTGRYPVKETNLTFEQLTELATKNTVAIAHLNETVAQLSNSVITLHSDVMTLHNDVMALAETVKSHDGRLEALERMVENTGRQLQAYLNTLPKS